MPQTIRDHGWTNCKNDHMILHWTCGDIVPVQLVDVLENLEPEPNRDNDDDHGDLDEISTDTDSCDEYSDEDF